MFDPFFYIEVKQIPHIVWFWLNFFYIGISIKLKELSFHLYIAAHWHMKVFFLGFKEDLIYFFE